MQEPTARILVVDDEPTVVRTCIRMLDRQGYQVQGVHRGQEALARLEKESFDLLLVDLLMPGMDGLSLLRQARERDPYLTAIVITGYGTLENVVEALRTGARDLVLKPFTPEDLISAVDRVLEERRQMQKTLLLQARLPILEIGQMQLATGDARALAQRLLEVTVQQVPASRAALLLLNEQADELYVASAIGLPAEAVTRVPVGAVQHREGVLAVGPDSPWRALAAEPDDPTVRVPLLAREKVFGVLVLSRTDGSAPFTPGELDLLSVLCGQIAVVLENARLYEAVRQGATRYRTLAENLPNGAVILFDHDLRYVVADGAGLAEVGLSKEGLVGRTIWEILAPETCTLLEPRYRAALAGQADVFDVPFADRIYEVRTLPIRDDSGKVVAGMAMTQDVTDRKQAEEVLRASEERLRTIFDTMTEGLALNEIVYDENGEMVDYRILEVNPAFYFTADYSGNKVVGAVATELYGMTPDFIKEFWKEHKKKNQVAYTEMSSPLRNRCFFVATSPFADDKFVTSFLDITERKQTEEVLRETKQLLETILAHTHVLVAYLDPDFNFVWVNQAYAKADDRDPAFFPGQNHFHLYPNAENEAIFRRVVETGEPFFAYAKPFEYAEHPERGVSYWDWSLIPLHDPGGAVAGLVFTLVDVTERKQAERERERLLAAEHEQRALAESLAAQNAQLYQETRRQVEELTLLDRVGRAITSSLDLDHFLVTVTEEAHLALDVERTSVWLLDDETGELVLEIAIEPQWEKVQGYRLAPGQGIAGWVAQAGQSLLVPDVRADSRFHDSLDTITGFTTRSILCVPLQAKGRVVGVLQALNKTTGEFGPDDVRLLTAIAQGAVMAIENIRLFEAVKQQREHLRALTARLTEAEELERQQLARELHDQIGQNLTALGINLNITRSLLPGDAPATGPIQSRLDDSLALVAETTERVRLLMADLRPPVLDDYGLVAALHWCGEQFTTRTGIPVTVEGQDPDPRPAVRVENALFRIAQEALTNASKHAQATQVTMTIAVDDETARLTITDNGIGFELTRESNADHDGWGLLTMSERAEAVGGRCRVESHPGQGTRVTVAVPR